MKPRQVLSGNERILISLLHQEDFSALRADRFPKGSQAYISRVQYQGSPWLFGNFALQEI